MATRKLVTDPAILASFNQAEAPSPVTGTRKKVTDPAILQAFGAAPTAASASIPNVEGSIGFSSTASTSTPSGDAPAPSKWESLGRGAEQGLTLGFGDELRGVLAHSKTMNDNLMTEQEVARRGQSPDQVVPVQQFRTGGAKPHYISKDKKPEIDASYQKAVDANRADNEGAQKANPWTYFGGQIAGGVAPSIIMSPASAAARGAPILGRVGAGALDGAAQGAVMGAGSATEGNRAAGAAFGGTIGAGIGGALPGVTTGIKKSVQLVADAFMPQANNALTPLSRGAREYATSQLSDPAKITAQQQALSTLGPEGTLADVSPEWLGVARGAASRPGSRDAVVNALLERDAGKNTRLAADLDASLGPAKVPSQIEASLKTQKGALSPDYEAAINNAQPVNLEPLAKQLDTMIGDLRGRARSAAEEVRGMLNAHGTDVLDQSPRAMMATRQAIDGMISGTNNTNVQHVLSMARAEVDKALEASVPGIKQVDNVYADLSRQSDALTRGGQVLDNGKTAVRPAELEAEVTALAQPRGELQGPSAAPLQLREGARAEIDRVAGTNSNDPAAIQKLVRGEGDWNRNKLSILFGPDNAKKALDAVDRETTFFRTGHRVGAGSDTAMAQRFGNFLDETAKPVSIPTDTTLTGGILRTGQRILGGASQRSAEKNAQKFANELGALSVAKGDARDQIIQALMDAAEAQKGPINPRIQMVIDALSGSTRQAAGQELAPPVLRRR